MKRILILTAACALLLTSCGTDTSSAIAQMESAAALNYQQITQEEAVELMQADNNSVTVDVRRQDEYDSGHIPDAILIPNESIGTEKPDALPDLDQIILIYCRSGRRSKEAAQKLADMGYTNVYEFGGIIDWKGEITTE